MPEDTFADPTDPGTLHPDAAPIRSCGDYFTPIECPDFDF